MDQLELKKPSIEVLNEYDPKSAPDPYVLVLADDNEPYNIEDLVKIRATDALGKDISDKVVYDSSTVDFRRSGDYPVEISVMDVNLNMSTTFLIIHVVTPKEAKIIESGKKLYYRSTAKKTKQARLENKLEWLFYSIATMTFIGFIIYTFVDAF